MKKAKITIAGVYADCPECGGPLSDKESGSHIIPINQYGKDDSFICDDCGKSFGLEARAFKN